MSSRRAFFTICSENYMAYARTLGQSLTAHHPDADFFIILADTVSGQLDFEALDHTIIKMSELNLPSMSDMTLRYTIMELNTAIKPAAILHLMQSRGYEQVVYLDPDIYCVSPFEELFKILDHGSIDCVLTPHACEPLEDGLDPDDKKLLRTGAYNLGFCAFRKTHSSMTFLNWWHRRLETECVVDLKDGLFVDQKFMDLAPCYIQNVYILKHSGYNAAYWNLAHRPVVKHTAGEWVANNQPLRFFHFSGVVPGNRQIFSKHQNRFGREDLGVLAELLDHYLDQLDANDHDRWKIKPYGYDFLDDVRLDAMARRVYRAIHPEPPETPVSGKQIEAACRSRSRASGLNLYSYETWRAREDLHSSFDVHSAIGRQAFIHWLYAHGIAEMHLVEARLPTRTSAQSFLGRAGGLVRRLRRVGAR